MSDIISADAVRSAFSEAMSAMYRQEVPLYGELVDIVTDINRAVLNRDAVLHAQQHSRELDRLSAERHGAVRIGTADELSALRRIFAVMGMHPVGYYDLAIVGVPVHSTAFRPIDSASLAINPFRVFTSLLRVELIQDPELRKKAASILASRKIVSDRAMALVAIAETIGGLTSAQTQEFVAEVIETFRWQQQAAVDLETYRRLSEAHRLVADVVSFKGPHINHLTPRTLDIDAAHAEMKRRGIDAKRIIEGPPRRNIAVLLRQTSFKALEESVSFPNARGGQRGAHMARFGEIEQRGIALTRAGHRLYDACLSKVHASRSAPDRDYDADLVAAFAPFPDDLGALRTQRLAYFRYSLTTLGRAAADRGAIVEDDQDLEGWIEAGWVSAKPIIYEDFLPVSAAGIFQSNLGGDEQSSYSAGPSQQAFEQALGTPVLDPFALYKASEAESLRELKVALRKQSKPVSA